MKKIGNSELRRPTPGQFAAAEKNPVTVILDNIRSLNNIGSFFRTCDAFAMERIVLCGITAVPPNKEIHKTALGAELTVSWEYYREAAPVIRELRSRGYRIVAVEQAEGAVSLEEYRVMAGGKYALVFGNEVSGVSQDVMDICDEAIEIPQHGTKHSLNVAVAGGVVLWEFFRNYLK